MASKKKKSSVTENAVNAIAELQKRNEELERRLASNKEFDDSVEREHQRYLEKNVSNAQVDTNNAFNAVSRAVCAIAESNKVASRALDVFVSRFHSVIGKQRAGVISGDIAASSDEDTGA